MAPTSKYQFSYYTRNDPNAYKALQEPTTTLNVICLSQKIGTLIEIYRLLDSKFNKDGGQYNHPGFPLLHSLSGLQLIFFVPNAGYFPLDATYVPWIP
jgi:hypothetical protein